MGNQKEICIGFLTCTTIVAGLKSLLKTCEKNIRLQLVHRNTCSLVYLPIELIARVGVLTFLCIWFIPDNTANIRRKTNSDTNFLLSAGIAEFLATEKMKCLKNDGRFPELLAKRGVK